MAEKVVQYLGYFLCKKICDQDFSKVAQSGHTGPFARNKNLWKYLPTGISFITQYNAGWFCYY